MLFAYGNDPMGFSASNPMLFKAIELPKSMDGPA
jgi:hypothetical protein